MVATSGAVRTGFGLWMVPGARTPPTLGGVVRVPFVLRPHDDRRASVFAEPFRGPRPQGAAEGGVGECAAQREGEPDQEENKDGADDGQDPASASVARSRRPGRPRWAAARLGCVVVEVVERKAQHALHQVQGLRRTGPHGTPGMIGEGGADAVPVDDRVAPAIELDAFGKDLRAQAASVARNRVQNQLESPAAHELLTTCSPTFSSPAGCPPAGISERGPEGRALDVDAGPSRRRRPAAPFARTGPRRRGGGRHPVPPPGRRSRGWARRRATPRPS